MNRMEQRDQSNNLGNYNDNITEGDLVQKAAQRVNLTIQSVLHQETLLLRQLQSIEGEEEGEERTITFV